MIQRITETELRNLLNRADKDYGTVRAEIAERGEGYVSLRSATVPTLKAATVCIERDPSGDFLAERI